MNIPLLDRIAAVLERSAPSRRAYALAAGIGLATNLLVFGLGHMLGTSPYWILPLEDARAYLMGYRYFLHEPWHWPPFSVHDMNVPFTKNIVFTDSIPLWAAVNKILAAVIPSWGRFSTHAYLGMWSALTFMLQACLGVANLRALGKKTWLQTLVAASFFLTLPAFCFRYGHASLSAHYLVLTALCLYLRTPANAALPRRIGLGFLALLAVAAMINPYHVAMAFGLFVVSLMKTRQARSVPWAVAGLVSIGLAAATAGFFTKEANVPMGGFDVASANLLSPFIPRRSVLLGDMRWLADTEAVTYQYEGYDYLGLGVLALLVLFLPRIASVVPTIKRHPYLFALALATWLFSLSNHVYFGSHRVVTYELPGALHWVTEQYRGPGRFIWLPTYVLLVFLLRSAMDRPGPRWQLFALPMLAALQIVDGGLGDWKWERGYTRGPFAHYLDLEVWRTLIEAHQSVEIDPPYDCILDGTTPNIDRLSQEVQFLTSETALPINGVYSARPTRDCGAERKMRARLTPKAGTLYVVLSPASSSVPRLEALGATCWDFHLGHVCSTNRDALALAAARGHFSESQRAPIVALGERIALDTSDADKYMVSGWASPDGQNRWSMDDVASVVMRISAPPTTLNVRARAPLCAARLVADVDVRIDGNPIGVLHFGPDANDNGVARSLPIPPSVREGLTIVEFLPRDVRSPKALGCNDDPRTLGIAVRELWFE